MNELIGIVAIALLGYATYRAIIAIKQIDELIWMRLRYDPQGGPNTTHQSPTLLGKQVVEVAKRYLGIEEQPRGSNQGPYINEFLKHVGLPPGNPWVAPALRGR